MDRNSSFCIQVNFALLTAFYFTFLPSSLRAESALLEHHNAVLRAATLKKEHVDQASRQMVHQLDSKFKIAVKASARQRRMTAALRKLKFSYPSRMNGKVYIAKGLNAFTTSDGSIRIYSELLDQLSENELLAVLGHEVGHLSLGHIYKRQRAAILQVGMSTVLEAAQVSSIPELDSISLQKLHAAIMVASFSRAQETEADAFSIRVLRKLGIDKSKMISALRKLSANNSKAGNNSASLTDTHPAIDERISAIEALAENEELLEEKESEARSVKPKQGNGVAFPLEEGMNQVDSIF